MGSMVARWPAVETALPFADSLPRHAALVDALRREVARSATWRWLELSCSLAHGRGDELSDVDVGVGYAGLAPADLDGRGLDLVHALGPVADVLVHQPVGWPETARRFAVEYDTGVQLDLGMLPSERRVGLPGNAVAVVDKDGRLAQPWTPPVELPPTVAEAREWVLAGWWAVSDATKYLRRGSLFEAVERLVDARQQAMRLFAAARRVPYPSFGIVSLLDFHPFELPPALADTYCVPTDRGRVLDATAATAQLLASSAALAGDALRMDVATPFEAIARARLAEARRQAE